MKKDYNTVVEVSLLKEKNYLLDLCTKGRVQSSLHQCFTIKELKKIVSHPQMNKELYKQAILSLYQSKNFESMEEQLIMMNKYFCYQEFKVIKEELFQKICERGITINEYCVLRHLVDFNNISFECFIEYLHSQYMISDLDCAKICLLEDESHLAYEYLKQLDDCNDETILDLLNTSDYISLKRHYSQKRKECILLPTH